LFEDSALQSFTLLLLLSGNPPPPPPPPHVPEDKRYGEGAGPFFVKRRHQQRLISPSYRRVSPGPILLPFAFSHGRFALLAIPRPHFSTPSAQSYVVPIDFLFRGFFFDQRADAEGNNRTFLPSKKTLSGRSPFLFYFPLLSPPPHLKTRKATTFQSFSPPLFRMEDKILFLGAAQSAHVDPLTYLFLNFPIPKDENPLTFTQFFFTLESGWRSQETVEAPLPIPPFPPHL